jgi:hypothetical protein
MVTHDEEVSVYNFVNFRIKVLELNKRTKGGV